MSNERKMTFTVDIQGQIKDLQSQVEKGKKLLDSLTMPDLLKQSTNKDFAKIEERFKKVLDYVANNQLDFVDEKKARSELNAISKEYTRVIEKAKNNAKNIKFTDDKNGQALANAIDQYNKKIKESNKDLKEQKQVLADLRKDLQATRDQMKSETEPFKNNLKDARTEAEKYRTEIAKLNAEEKAKRASKIGIRTPNEIEADIAKSHIPKDRQKAQEAQVAALAKVEKAQEALTKKEKEFTGAIEDANKKISEQQEAINKTTKDLQSSALNSVILDLKELQEKGGLSPEINLDNIDTFDKLQQLFDKIDGKNLENVNKVLGEVEETSKQTSKGIEQVDKTIDKTSEDTKKFADTLDSFKQKAAYFFGIENAINLLKRAVRSAFNTVKELDEVMTETAVVTNFDVGDMWDQLPQYTQRANELGVSIHDAYKAATLYYQQGLKTNEVMAVSNETLKMARIANLDAADATSRMTNALRGFNMEINETSAQRVNDVYSELAAITASDTKEISTAMTKVASLAHNANMEFETTSAFLAQMIETTRESAETAGTALKTVIARFSEVKKLYSQGDLMGTDEEGEEIDVNKVSQALRSAGINMNEYLSGAKGLDDVFLELASKWDSLDMIQQRYIATMAAGSRQQSRFIAMMSDYKRTTELVAAANNSAGASQRQFNKTLESFQSKLAKLKNSWDTFLMGIADNEVIKGFIDLLTTLIDNINKLTKGLDGIPGSLARIGIAAASLKVGKEISTSVISSLLKMKKDADKIAEGTGEGFIQRLIKPFTSIKSIIKTNLGTNTKPLESLIVANKIGGLSSLRSNAVDKLQGSFLNDKKLSTLQQSVAAQQLLNGQIDENTILQAANSKQLRESIKVTDAQSLAVKMGATNMGYFVGVMGLATVALGLLVAVFKRLNDDLGIFKTAGQMAAERLEELEETSNNASQAAQEASESYNTLKSSLESLNEKYEGIEKMTRGTQEWRDAVLEVNNEVLSLSEKYKDLELTSENGVLKVANAEDVKKNQYRYSVNAQAANLATQMQVAHARTEAHKAKFGDVLAQIPYANYRDAMSPVSASIAGYFDRDATSLNEQAIELLKERNELEKEELKITEQRMASTASLAISNADLRKDTESQTSNYLNANRMESYYNAAFNAIAEEGMKVSDVKEEIAKESGFLNYAGYVKEFGEIADEAAQGMLANIRATKKATTAAEKFSNKLGGMPKEIQKMYSRSDLAGLSAADMQRLLGQEEYEKYKEADKEEQNRIVRLAAQKEAEKQWDKMTEPERDAYGSIEAYLSDYGTDWVKSFENSTLGLEQAITKMAQTTTANSDFQKDFNENVLGKLSGGAANALADNFSKVFVTAGGAGIRQIQEQISSITEGWSDDRAETFIKALNSIDWEDIDSVKSLDGLLKEYGILDVNTKELTEDIIQFSHAIKKVDFEKTTEQLGKIFSLIANFQGGNLKETEWTADQMQLALDAGAELDDFIYDPLTDTYTLVDKDLSEIIKLLNDKATLDKETLEESVATGMAANVTKEQYNKQTREGQLGFFSAMKQQGKVNSDYVSYLQGLSDEEIAQHYNDYLEKYVSSLNENTEALKKLNDSKLMNMDPLELAEMNTEESRDALIGQAKRYGADEDLINRNQGNQSDMAIINGIFREAQSREYDTDELNDYIKNLKLLNDELDDVSASQVALTNTKFVNGLKKIVDSYEDWTKLLDEEGNLIKDLDEDSAKILADLKNAANEMLSTDLSDKFWEASENIDLIRQAAEGSSEALAKLNAIAMKEKFIKIGIDTNQVSNEINALSDWLAQHNTEYEVNTTLNTGEFIETLNKLIEKTGMGVDQIEKTLSSMGWSGAIVPDGTTTVKVPHVRPAEGGSGLVFDFVDQQVPKWKLQSVTKATNTSLPPSITPPKTSGGGGGSGSSKEDKPDYWENPFDELYNLQEKINESIRTREALERKYQKTVKLTESRLGEVTKAYADQIKQLRAEADLEKQMQEGRARQLNNVQNEIYTDSEGNRATFASLGVTKYASYDQATGLLQIDWSGLEEIAKDPNRTKEGEAAEAYIKRLEELQSQFEEVRDKLWDIEDRIEELREEAIDNYLTFEDRVMEALVNSYQQEIDDFKDLSDTIKSTTDDVIKNIQEDVALARQIRDNTKKEEDIAEMEARLAYLRRDTSGANDLEIKQLEEELNQARQDYSDDLIDQQIQQMQNEAEKAAEQREHQIDLMQHSLDMAIKNGDLWEEVYGLIDGSVNDDGSIKADSELMKLLKEGESFQSLSLIGQKKWMDEVAQAIKEALVGLGEAEDKWNIGDNDRRTGVSLDTFVERLYKEVLGRDADEAGKKYWVEQLQSGKLSRTDVLKSFLGSEEFSKKNMGDEDFVETLYKTFFGRASDAEGKSYWTGQLKSGAKTRDDLINEFLKSTEWINSFMPKPGTGTKKPIGGGTSWADDGEKLPTMLDRKDSENLVVLKDILGNLLNVSGGDAVKSNGDIYFDIHIDAELASDYDVDQLAERIKKEIYDTSSYRNANVINYIR